MKYDFSGRGNKMRVYYYNDNQGILAQRMRAPVCLRDLQACDRNLEVKKRLKTTSWMETKSGHH